MRRGVGFVVVALIIGAVAGSVVGEMLGRLAPHGVLHAIFTRGPSVDIPHFTIDLPAFTLSFGLMMRLNLCTLIGVAAAVYSLRR